MATLRERMRARREAERRGLRSFTIGVSEDDLRVIAKHGYGGALSTDDEQQAQAVSRFITDALAARLALGDCPIGCCNTFRGTSLPRSST
jgi:hypothetical protein